MSNGFLTPGLADEIQEDLKGQSPGRPSVYTEDAAHEILRRTAQGEPILRICRSEHLPARSTVYEWLHDNLHGFADKFARAKELGAEAIRDETFDIADDGFNDWMEKENKDGSTFVALNKEAIMRSKLRIDQRQWYLSVFKPSVYGNKQSVELTGKDGGPVHMKSEVKADKIAALLSQAEARKPKTETQDDDVSDLI